jgi:NADH-quinone oxidoreductase subunit E
LAPLGRAGVSGKDGVYENVARPRPRDYRSAWATQEDPPWRVPGWEGANKDVMKSIFSEAARQRIPTIIARYPVKRAALLPLLWVVQEEHGYISEEAMAEVAGLLDLTPPQVFQTISFYTMYNTKPIGKFHIQVCRSLMCALVGTGDVMRWIRAKLGIRPGETTPDKLFTLKQVECLASCATGPMMQINDDYYESLSQEKVDRILDDLKREGRSSLASGPFIVPLTEVKR